MQQASKAKTGAKLAKPKKASKAKKSLGLL